MSNIAERYKEWKKKQSDLSERYRSWNAKNVARDIYRRTNAWITSTGDFIKGYNERYGGDNSSWRGDASDYYNNALKSTGEFDTEADAILDLMNRYGEYFDDDFKKSIGDALSGNRESYGSALKGAESDRDYWGQWESQEEYEYAKYATQLDDLMGQINSIHQNNPQGLDQLEQSEVNRLTSEMENISSTMMGDRYAKYNAHYRYNKNAKTIAELEKVLADEYGGPIKSTAKSAAEEFVALIKGENLDTRYDKLNRQLEELKAENDSLLEYVDPERYEEYKNLNWAQKALNTGLNVAQNIHYGALKSIEDVVDFVNTVGTAGAKALSDAGIELGTRSGLMDEITANAHRARADQKEAERIEKINYDWSGNNLLLGGKQHDYYYDKNLLSGNTAANDLVTETAQGVGRLLPHVALSVASGGVGSALSNAGYTNAAANLTKTVPQLSKAAFALSAAGSGANEAFEQGASSTQAFGYGAATGALETATEYLGGMVLGESVDLGSTAVGRFLQKHGLDKYVTQGLGKYAYTFASEGSEEVLADLASPVIKAAFDIGDSRDKYFGSNWKQGWAEIRKGLFKTFAVGGLVGITMQGLQSGVSALANLDKGGARYNAISEQMEIIENSMKANEILQASNKVTKDQKISASEQLNATFKESIGRISNSMKKLTAEQRNAVFEEAPILAAFLDENGEISADLESRDVFNSSRIDSAVDSLRDESVRESVKALVQGEIVSDKKINAVLANNKAREILSLRTGVKIDKNTTVREVKEAITEAANDHTRGKTALVLAASLDMGANGARAVARIVENGSGDVAHIVQAFNAVYQAGKQGKAITEAKNPYLSELSFAEKKSAYEYGVMDAMVDKTKSEAATVSKKEEVAQNGKAETTLLDADKTAERQKKIDNAEKSQSRKEGKVIYEGDRTKLSSLQKRSLHALDSISKALGVTFHIFESQEVDGKRVAKVNGKETSANGWYDTKTGEIWIDINAGVNGDGLIIWTASHELTHFIKQWSPEKFKVFADFLLENYAERGISKDALIDRQIAKAKKNGREISRDEALEEVIADSCETFLLDSNAAEKIIELRNKDKSLAQKILDFLKKALRDIKAMLKGVQPDSYEGKLVSEMTGTLQQLHDLWSDALADASEAYSTLANIDLNTESVSPMLSERTWTASEYVTEREATAKKISDALGVDMKTAYKYIDDINGVARLIADDRARLDYEPNLDEKATVLKPNSEYKYSVDMSTLCAKRLLFTGTFDAIQKALPNTVFDSEEIVALREMMQDRGYEVACGICYVESTRREIGRITQEFIDRYKIAQETGQPISRINSSGKEVVLKSEGKTFSADKNYTPNLGELNTTDIDIVKRDHPEVYDAYLAFMNARGQAKPKLLETRAEYKGEILKHFKAKSAVEARNNAGGLRLQSFSDFEVPHMIDMMQIVMDMSRVGLKSQAYTKVPAFAEVFGGTGIKINLSLIAKGEGLDANGNLVFDDVEGINHKEAFKLRDKYSKNVGTILVGKTDAHIIAAMADSRIDYIIPFHKSSWKESLYDALGLTGYADYTDYQNEKSIDKDRKIKNFDPSEYWDFSKSGDENAQIYLEKCREDGRIPKFPQFQGYPGYWKLLIDFKMYDNDGVGSPQEVVRPTFNTEASERILSEYKGGHKSFPVAKDVVEDFVKEHKDRVMYSERDPDALTNREVLANMLDSVAESDRDKAFLDKYKARLNQIDADKAEIARLKEEKKGTEKLRREVITSKIEKLEKGITESEKWLKNLEETATLKRLVSKEREARYAEGVLAGQMAQGKADAKVIR
jgi:hypothetical protein